ncbi:hypothetical protein [Bosea sp. AS-1]|uniref:hypothetical protein n=1 Tax=Bosea sp. AS-1 TaxID=2015316 RepID=UPI000B77D9DE|nr:hypothetical protein [Bosea sp. AS-1]
MGQTDRNRSSIGETSVHPLLLYIAISLLAVSGILQAEIHRERVQGVGVTISTEPADARLLGP